MLWRAASGECSGAERAAPSASGSGRANRSWAVRRHRAASNHHSSSLPCVREVVGVDASVREEADDRRLFCGAALDCPANANDFRPAFPAARLLLPPTPWIQRCFVPAKPSSPRSSCRCPPAPPASERSSATVRRKERAEGFRFIREMKDGKYRRPSMNI